MGEPATETGGLYVPERGQVAIRDPDGSVWKIPQEELVEAQHQGARPASEQEYFGAKHGKVGEAAAGLAGAARGASFGTFDPALVETARALGGDENAEDYRRTLRLLKETHQGISTGGELAGAVVPALFGGGGASAARAGEGLLARGAATIARAGAEGAAVGLGSQLSEDTLQNHKRTAESYLTAGVKGGAIGLLLGTGAVGLGAAGDRLGALFGRGGERGGLRAEEAIGARLERAEEGSAYRAATKAEGATAATEKGYFARRLETEADVQRFKATGANPTDWKRLAADTEQRGAEAQRIGKRLGEETFEGKPLVEALATQEEIAKRIAGRTKEVAKSFRPMYAEADKAAARPSMASIVDRFKTEVRAEQAGKLYGDVELRGAEDALSRLEKGGPSPSHIDLWERRKEIDGILKKSYARDTNGITPVGEESLKKLRAIVNDELLASTERAGTELGGTLGDRIRVANALYSDLRVADKAASRASQRMSGHQAISITDAIAGAAGGLPGLAAMGANMVRRKFGNQIAAHALDAASRMESIQRAATKLDDALNHGTKAFVANSKGVSRPAKMVSTEEIRALRNATRSPEVVTSRVAEAIGDMPRYAPKIAQAVGSGATRAAAWLQHSLPKEAVPVGPQFTQRKPAPISDTERIKAANVIETIEDPTVVIDRLRQGSLTREHVATLKYVHPETFAKIQTYLTDHAAELRADMTVQQLTQLSILFGKPLTAAMLPENVRAFQASFTQGSQAPGPGGGPPPGGAPAPTMNAGPIKGGGSRATAFDKVESGQ